MASVQILVVETVVEGVLADQVLPVLSERLHGGITPLLSEHLHADMVPLLVEHLLGDVAPFTIHLDLGSESQDHPPPMYFGLDRSSVVFLYLSGFIEYDMPPGKHSSFFSV
ncbi:hypothetical protein SERLA73DRAFT_80800 [Serpula lacrymans var. lacrymans S7.3]|uniref:Uncharacterized protein n=1 Tax=Serpula lacrymans var. lacrymans (strain S7.3) TaxID=936435 RepID=F8QKA3_SERL3|nr:hypothetical protein SERLA73DRAFT_80800 [Serpula lacrymans var. lacrymans S7.3]